MSNEYLDTRDLVDELSTLGVDDWQNTDLVSDIEDEDDRERAAEILDLFAEISDYAGDRPEDGIQLIREDHFTDAMRELVEDCGYLPKDLPGFIEYNIDWDGVADDLRVDYTSVEFDGYTWWYR